MTRGGYFVHSSLVDLLSAKFEVGEMSIWKILLHRSDGACVTGATS